MGLLTSFTDSANIHKVIAADAPQFNDGVQPLDARFCNTSSALTANTAYFVRFRVAEAITIGSIDIQWGATSSNNIDVGIYNSADGGTTLTRLGSSGSTAASGNASTTQNIPLTGNVALAPGTDYWAAAALDSATPTVVRAVGSGPAALLGGNGMSKATSFPLPASATTFAATGSLVWCRLKAA